jgi:hypothetical protein
MIYWRILPYPFVQDDWGQLKGLAHTDAYSWISSALSMRDKLFYRPISLIYYLVYYKVFGLNPLYFHIVGLTIHLFNSLLVVIISRRLIANRAISVSAGLIYAAAATVHLDPLLWMVGFCDLSATFLYFAAIALFLAGRRYLSTVAFGIGLLAKESVVVVLLIFVLFLVYSVRPLKSLPAAIIRSLWPPALVLSVYSLARIGFAVSPFSLRGSEPYSMRLFGVHIAKNLFRYAWWGLQAVTPLRSLPGGTARWILWAMLVAGVLLWILSKRVSQVPLFPSGWGFLLAGWAVAGILPALLLPNHWYRYYLTYSLLPLILLLLSGAWWTAQRFSRRGQEAGLERSAVGGESLPLARPPIWAVVILGSLVLADFASAAWYFRTKDRAGVSDRYEPGTNHLIHRGHTAKAILDYLARSHATVPKGSVFVLEGCDVESLGGEDALRVFYADESIRVFNRLEVVIEIESGHPGGMGTRGNPDDISRPTVQMEPGKVFLLHMVGGTIHEVDPSQGARN